MSRYARRVCWGPLGRGVPGSAVDILGAYHVYIRGIGGYTGDQCEKGCQVPGPNIHVVNIDIDDIDDNVNVPRQMDSYYFRHWANIDTFVYFSHHLLTIPPPGVLYNRIVVTIIVLLYFHKPASFVTGAYILI